MEETDMYEFRPFIGDLRPSSTAVIRNPGHLLDEQFGNQCSLDLMGVLEDSQKAVDEKILATPTLVRLSPEPVKRVIGDLSDKKDTLASLDLMVREQ